MKDDKAWDRITDAIETKFGIDEHGKFSRPLSDNPDLTEAVAFVIFTRDGDRYKIERVSGPAIIDRKTMGARRAGATITYQNVYDPTEVSLKSVLFKELAGEWQETTPESIGLANA